MKFYAINGRPRKNKNTAQLLDKSLEGIKSVIPDAEVERINLYDLDFKGCKSCFSCKRIGGKNYGKCAINDDLAPVLEKLSLCDGVILGSPIYFGDVTGELRSFIERFAFPYLTYSSDDNIAPKRMPTACIYTMNCPEEIFDMMNYQITLNTVEGTLEAVFKKPITMCSFDTYQFNDYSKFKSDMFDEAKKLEVRETQFPKDLKEAYELGQKLSKLE
ncbi:flavodoxin family protein [Methanobrevibacter sp.]